VWDDAGQVRQRRKLDEINGLIQVYDKVLEPAFIKRGWNLASIKKERISKGCKHANCLGWAVYSAAEKNEIEIVLYELSSSLKVKFYISIYKRNMGVIVNTPNQIHSGIISTVKKILFKMQQI
jgi:hypothetical protein